MASVGIDISSDYVDIDSQLGRKRVPRTKTALVKYFQALPGDSKLVMEPTGRLHRLIIEAAVECGLEAHLVDPLAFSYYRRSMSPRAKNDRIDAALLKRYGDREPEKLSEPKKLPDKYQRLKDLLELRRTQVELKVSWKQSMSELSSLPASSLIALKAIEKAILDLDREIREIVEGDPLYEMFLSMDGVGPQLAPALVWLFRAFDFKDKDQVIAFVGLDVKVRDSGKYVGQRKLTKRGPAFVRQLIYCASNSCRRIAQLKPIFEKHHRKGLRTKAVNMIFGRRILKAAFTIRTTGARYDREKFAGGT